MREVLKQFVYGFPVKVEIGNDLYTGTDAKTSAKWLGETGITISGENDKIILMSNTHPEMLVINERGVIYRGILDKIDEQYIILDNGATHINYSNIIFLGTFSKG